MRGRRVAALAGALAVLIVAPAAVGAEPGASRQGWWGRSVRSALPAPVPLTLPAAVPSPAPPAPDVPVGALAVAAISGQVHRVGAVAFGADSSGGLLTLREAEGPLAQWNVMAAGIVACPITGYWAPEAGADLSTAPDADCTRGVPGVRHDDGTWTFDLATLGQLTDGVRLDPVTDGLATFQVALAGDSATLGLAPSTRGEPLAVDDSRPADAVAAYDVATSATGASAPAAVVTPAPVAAPRSGLASPLLAVRTGSSTALPASAAVLAVLAGAMGLLVMWSLGRDHRVVAR